MGWSDVIIGGETGRRITYRTGLTVYEEALVDGKFLGQGWNGAGFVGFYEDNGKKVDVNLSQQAFRLEIDGQLLGSGWEWGGVEKKADETRPGFVHIAVTLNHSLRPVTVRVHTKLDGSAVLTRWLEIRNTGDRPAAVSAADSWCGVLQKIDQWSKCGEPDSLFSLGCFEDSNWGAEGNFQWHPLPAAAYRVDGRCRRDRYRHPMFVLRNNMSGEHFIGQFAWSGGYSFEFDLNPDYLSNDRAALTFRAGMDAPAPLRMLAPGEAVATPEMHLGLVFGDLDAAVNAMHGHLRDSVFRPQAKQRGGWLESGLGPELEITPEEVFHAIDLAAEAGAEVFYIDASWYAPPKADWFSTVGDWKVCPERFPDGLAPFRERVHKKGMLWGLWMEPERIGVESETAKAHPEWLAKDDRGKSEWGGLLDLGNPEVAAHVERQIVRVIEEHQLDMFRLDFNVHPGQGMLTVRDGFLENGYWRYYDALYGIFARLRDRFPEVIFENCAGGGGRTDIGMVRNFCHTWISDNQIAPYSFRILNGMTMALPPEYADRLIGGMFGYTKAELEFQCRLLLFARPTYGFLRPRGEAMNPLIAEFLRNTLRHYVDFVRPFMATGKIYHHTPEIKGAIPQGFGVLEMTSADGGRGICGLFRLAGPADPEYLLRLRGIDVSRRYRVTFGNAGRTCEIPGCLLATQGLSIRLEGALTSELLSFESMD